MSTTTTTQHYPFDYQHLQTIIRTLMQRDPWFAELWEPAYGGLINAQISPKAYPMQVSWIRDSSGTKLKATLLEPLQGRRFLVGKGTRASAQQQAALQEFFTKLDRAIEQHSDTKRGPSVP